ncbi:MAG: hypothetical protein MI922_18285 [Bacteroidales bacterium]|nr:hypothetical protein [Bacteroidales bacterium]
MKTSFYAPYLTLTILYLNIMSVTEAQTAININPDPSGEPWFVSNITDEQIEDSWANVSEYKSPKRALKSSKTLPSRINNSEHKYFRPIFNQSGGCCSQASGIGYVFTYEISLKRDIDVKNNDNWMHRYPTHFTWNFLNGGYGGGSYFPEGWLINMDHGTPTTETYGGGMNPLGATAWMNGYDKWYKALKNKCITGYSKIYLNSEEGVENTKKWLHNHNRTSDTYGGIASFYGKMTGISIEKIPAGEYEAGKSVVTAWGTSGGHAMTIVGYDDNVKWDFNADGRYTNDIDINNDGIVNGLDWESGAWIIANSWGENWQDSGFAYVPYKVLWHPNKFAGIIEVTEKYEPKAVMKVKITYSKRNQIKFKVGISESTNATSPSITKEFKKSFNNRAGEYPLCGENNTNTLEVGLDLTELMEGIDATETCKFFFQAITKEQHDPAVGEIEEVSVIMYPNKKETFSPERSVYLPHNSTTTVSVVVKGTPPTSIPSISNPELCRIQPGLNGIGVSIMQGDYPVDVNIFNVAGMLVKTMKLHPGNHYIPMDNGLYILRAKRNNEYISHKVAVY